MEIGSEAADNIEFTSIPVNVSFALLMGNLLASFWGRGVNEEL